MIVKVVMKKHPPLKFWFVEWSRPIGTQRIPGARVLKLGVFFI
jgi:hypothetical protein